MHTKCSVCVPFLETVFLEDQFIEFLASHGYAMPAAVKCAKYCFDECEGVLFLNQLRIPFENTLNSLHTSLLTLKCFKMINLYRWHSTWHAPRTTLQTVQLAKLTERENLN